MTATPPHGAERIVPRDDDLAALACLTAGTAIATAEGAVPAGWLRPGDLVVTRDRGLQPLRWLGRVDCAVESLRRDPALWPVRIEAGALGTAGPSTPLTASPSCRLVLRSAEIGLLFGLDEASVAVGDLVGWAGVEPEMPTTGHVYFQLLFDRPEVILADGLWCESLWLGDRAGAAWQGARGGPDAEAHRRRARPALARWEAHLLSPPAPAGAAAAQQRRTA